MKSATQWNARYWIAFVVIAALSTFMQFTNVRETEQGGVVHGDGVKYVFYAYNLKHHDTFSRVQSFSVPTPPTVAPDKLTLPGYPWFLSRFLGEGEPDFAFLARVESAQALLGVLSTMLAFLIALRLAPFGWAVAAGVLVATQPHLVLIGDYLLTEPLFTPLLLGFVLAGLRAASSDGKTWHAALCGLLLGFACLVRPQLQAIPWLLLLAVCFSPRLRPRLKQVALGAVVFAAVVLPWQLRNTHVERPQGDPDLLAASIYHGTFPNFMYQGDPRTLGYAYRYDPDQARYAQDLSATLAHVRDLFAAEPARYANWYLLGKPGAFLSWSMVAGEGDIYIYRVTRTPWQTRPSFAFLRGLHFWLHWPLMLLAVGTMCVALWRPAVVATDPDRRRAVVLVSSLLLFAIVLHMFGLPLPRYNIPFKPLEFAIALAGAAAAWEHLVTRRRRVAAAAPEQMGERLDSGT
jgi:4-amino-4-deoxy-L-arabinose transferase-like glycosyltransferase